MTHIVPESNMIQALNKIEKLASVAGRVARIRLETLD